MPWHSRALFVGILVYGRQIARLAVRRRHGSKAASIEIDSRLSRVIMGSRFTRLRLAGIWARKRHKASLSRWSWNKRQTIDFQFNHITGSWPLCRESTLTGAEDIAASFVFCDACQPPMIHAEMLFYHFITSFSGLSGFFQFPWTNMEQKVLCSEIILTPMSE